MTSVDTAAATATTSATTATTATTATNTATATTDAVVVLYVGQVRGSDDLYLRFSEP